MRAPRTGGVEYDVRNVLRFYSGNGPAAVSGLMRWEGMSREDAIESVIASGGSMETDFEKRIRLKKERRAGESAKKG